MRTINSQKRGEQKKRYRVKRKLVNRMIKLLTFLIICMLTILIKQFVFGSPYQKICMHGYKGSEEQFIASLVGEEIDPASQKTAYELAKTNGYEESEKIWMKTLTGESENYEGKTPYSVMCENEYDGSFAQWLTDITIKPNKLGKSKRGQEATEYELACTYGYEGSFIEWLVSISSEQVF